MEPYTLTGISTHLETLTQGSTQVVTIPTAQVQTTTLPVSTEYPGGSMGNGPAVAGATETVLTTIMSTSTVNPTSSTVSGSPITVTSSSPAGSTVTITTTDGGVVSTIRSVLFGVPPTTTVVPTTITVTSGQQLASTVVRQIINMASLPPSPGVATVVQILQVPTSGPLSAGSMLTTVTELPQMAPQLSTVALPNGQTSVATITAASLGTVDPTDDEVTATTTIDIGVPTADVTVTTTSTAPSTYTETPAVATQTVNAAPGQRGSSAGDSKLGLVFAVAGMALSLTAMGQWLRA